MSSTSDPTIDSPRVFISYAHESDDHKRQVLALGWLLRSQLGIDARLDEWEADERRDWSQWAIEQVDKSDFVLAIASPAFRDRADGRSWEKHGWGSRFEGAILRDKLTEDRERWIGRILPVVLPGYTINDIPEFLQPYSATHYIVDRLSADGIIDLRRVLTRQPRHPRPPLGTPPPPLPPEDITLPTAPPVPPVSRGRPPREGNTVQINGGKNKIGNVVAGDYHGEPR